MATRAEQHEARLAAWVDDREPELQRTAHLLTGDLATARTHVESALLALLAAEHLDAADLDPLALHALVDAVLGGRAIDPDQAADDVADPRQALVWDFLGTLSPARRTALVLRLYRGLDEREISRLVGGTPDSVADDVTSTLDDLAGLLRVSAAEAEAVATSTLAAQAEATPVVPTSVETVRAVARRRRTRRTRGGVLLAAAALVAVGVPAAALSGGGLPTPPPAGPSRSDGPAYESPDYGPEDRVPPPWVLPPGQGDQTFRVDIQTRCASPADEEFRSITTIRSGCRTVVVEPR